MRKIVLPLCLALIPLGSASALCKSMHFKMQLETGKGSLHPIGEGMMLVASNDQIADGTPEWHIDLLKEGSDYIYPVNPPIRFNPLQIIGPGYGQTFRDQTSDRTMKFLWKQQEFKKITELERDVLWPYDSPDPQKAAEDFASAVQNASIGELRLHVVDFKADDREKLRSISYDVEVVVPSEFRLALPSKQAECPQK